MIKLTNDFYSTIPQSLWMKRPPLINHLLRLREKIELLETLTDIELTHSYILKSIVLYIYIYINIGCNEN